MVVLGIDIGAGNIKAGMVDEAGAILAARTIATPPDLDSTRIETLGGGLHYLEGLRLSDLIGMPRDVPVFADNAARVALAGEMVWGAARGRQNVLMLTLGMGVGGAVLADGRILRGHCGVGGNLGHITVEPDGAPCICGNRGCLETVFSARAIEGEVWS